MKIVPFDQKNWRMDHPTGNIAFQHMLKGDPSSRDNFMYILAKQVGDFEMPRHRHNFDQIRLPLTYDMNHGSGIVLKKGQVGYFVEGMPYGPQSDPVGDTAKLGEKFALVLQFGGASGYGFMSIEQRREAWAELAKIGKFVGPHYHHPDGRVEWGLNTIWEHVFGEKLKYARPRYKLPVIVDPDSFNWLPTAGANRADRKYLGAFSERGVWTEMIRLLPGGKWCSNDPRARRLFVVLSGAGTVSTDPVGRWTAIQADPGETLDLASANGIELFLIGLPPIERPATESDQYDLEEYSAEDAAA